MIKTENFTINGREFIRTYSDSGYMIERDGIRYDEAIDPVEFDRTYTETETLTEAAEPNLKAQAYDILMGVTE